MPMEEFKKEKLLEKSFEAFPKESGDVPKEMPKGISEGVAPLCLTLATPMNLASLMP